MEPGCASFNPDFDLRRQRASREPLEPIEDSQRLIANPSLAVFFWTGTVALLRESIRRHELTFFAWALLLLVVGILFLQFHCLDCGKTGSLLASKRHACATVAACRELTLTPRRFHGPSLKVQLVVWFIFMTAAFLLVVLKVRSR